MSRLHKEYDEHKTVAKYNEMVNLKKNLLRSSGAKTDLSHNMIENELFEVVKKISSLTTNNDALSKFEPLSYNVMSIKEKIPSNNLLRNAIEGLVSSYFLYLKELFKSLDDVNFGTIALSFKHSYFLKAILTNAQMIVVLVQIIKIL